MGARRDEDGEASVGLTQDLARTQHVAGGGVVDRVTLRVDGLQRPKPGGWRMWSETVDASRVERASVAVLTRRQPQALAEPERDLAVALDAGAGIGIGVGRAGSRLDPPLPETVSGDRQQ